MYWQLKWEIKRQVNKVGELNFTFSLNRNRLTVNDFFVYKYLAITLFVSLYSIHLVKVDLDIHRL